VSSTGDEAGEREAADAMPTSGPPATGQPVAAGPSADDPVRPAAAAAGPAGQDVPRRTVTASVPGRVGARRDKTVTASAEQARVDRQEIAPAPEHHHRDVQAGGLRAAVFGVQDGLVSNALLVLGFAGADSGPSIVRLAGLFGLFSGAVSMASGEYNSMRVQRELFEQELAMERRELRHNPHVETVELTQIYQSRGFDPDQARELAQAVMQDPDQALEVHAREELGIAPDSLGSPLAAAGSSFGAFAVGALVPIIPWFFVEGTVATVASIVVAALAAAFVGSVVARLTRRPRLTRIARQVAFTLVPAAVTFLAGNLANAVWGIHLG
jgi:VIT1/CCC1 family predicted Fe2+/Mn2+ transporter